MTKQKNNIKVSTKRLIKNLNKFPAIYKYKACY